VHEIRIEGERKALKVTEINTEEEEEERVEQTSHALRDLAFMKVLQRHPNCMPVHDYDVHMNQISVLMPYGDCLIDCMETMTWDRALLQHIMRQLLSIVAYAHSLDVLHRDIKPDNIMVDPDKGYHLYLGDWGMARQASASSLEDRLMTPVVCTNWYRAPEIFLRLPYGKPSDLWSVGMCMYWFAFKKGFVDGDFDSQCLNQIFRVTGSPTADRYPTLYEPLKAMIRRRPKWKNAHLLEFSKPTRSFQYSAVPKFTQRLLGKDGLDLLSKLCNPEPSERITAVDALVHPYLMQKCSKCEHANK
jgi:serine/threonine protein kinase